MQDRFLFDPQLHSALQSVELLDLTGDGAGELIVESDVGGAGAPACVLHVFTMELENERTMRARGQQLCFVRIVHRERGQRFTPPRVDGPRYPRGLEIKDIDRDWLAPLR